MFNLIMLGFDWASNRATLGANRVFEYTDDHIRALYQRDGLPDLEKLRVLPCLFMEEGWEEEIAYVGHLVNIRQSARDYLFEFVIDREVPPLRNSMIYTNRSALGMPHDFEFHRNHWAVKDVDLYRFLLGTVRPRRQRPTVFQIAEHEQIEPQLASAMMPFDAGFGPVYQSISLAATNAGLRCRRADDIWENAAIIQDVVSLIDRSRIVICDCSGRNPNVFYEAGIAHTLGRDVILITQSEHDIPFDLRHLRYIRYFNNNEGRAALVDALQARMATILRN